MLLHMLIHFMGLIAWIPGDGGIRYGLIGDPDMNSWGTHPTANGGPILPKFMFNIVVSNCVDTFIVDLKLPN